MITRMNFSIKSHKTLVIMSTCMHSMLFLFPLCMRQVEAGAE